MAKTRADLVAGALTELLVIRAGEDPASEDAAAVDAAVDGVLADLTERNVYSVENVEAIPDEALRYLTKILADDVALSFGKTAAQPDAVLYWENQLRRLHVVKPSYETLQANYF